MKIKIHRGAHEIGGSCVEVQSKKSRIVIDIGMPLVKEGGGRFNFKDYEKLSGPELIKKKILPDIPGFYECGIQIIKSLTACLSLTPI